MTQTASIAKTLTQSHLDHVERQRILSTYLNRVFNQSHLNQRFNHINQLAKDLFNEIQPHLDAWKSGKPLFFEECMEEKSTPSSEKMQKFANGEKIASAFSYEQQPLLMNVLLKHAQAYHPLLFQQWPQIQHWHQSFDKFEALLRISELDDLSILNPKDHFQTQMALYADHPHCAQLESFLLDYPLGPSCWFQLHQPHEQERAFHLYLLALCHHIEQMNSKNASDQNAYWVLAQLSQFEDPQIENALKTITEHTDLSWPLFLETYQNCFEQNTLEHNNLIESLETGSTSFLHFLIQQTTLSNHLDTQSKSKKKIFTTP